MKVTPINITVHLVLSICISVQGQAPKNELPNSAFSSEILESQAENNELENENYQLIDELQQLQKNPIDINIATEFEMKRLPMLNIAQVAAIVNYRTIHGPFLSIYELNGVKGISVETLKELLPYIKASGYKENLPEKRVFVNQNLLFHISKTIETSKGYEASENFEPDSIPTQYFLGSPYHLKSRYRIEVGKYSGGISVENDPGEPMFSSKNKSFDYISAFAQRQSDNILKNLIIGDYTANFGQGLVLWSGFAQGKSSYATNIIRSKGGFSKYSSFAESQYLRGVASSLHFENIDISFFFSKKQRDANVLQSDSSGNIILVSSLQNTGIHALQREIEDKDALGEVFTGSNISFNYHNFSLGGTITYINYDAGFKKPVELYNYYAFSGNQLTNGSINYQADGRNFNVFGEFARNSNNGLATINGLMIAIVPEVSFACLHRYYAKDYFSPYAQSFSQGSNTNNEAGTYFGLELSPTSNLKASGYADFYSFPWLKYRINEPSYGSNYFIEICYSLGDSASITGRYSFLQKPLNNENETSATTGIIQTQQHKSRITLEFWPSSSIEIRNRVELTRYHKGSNQPQYGTLVYQDVKWKPDLRDINIVGRIAFFNTDGWDSRIYAFENDALYSFSIPAYNGKGIRFYSLLKWELFSNFNFWLKYSLTYYTNQSLIGEGPYQIPGNKKSDVTIQCIYTF
jgi:hypothetical protein